MGKSAFAVYKTQKKDEIVKKTTKNDQITKKNRRNKKKLVKAKTTKLIDPKNIVKTKKQLVIKKKNNKSDKKSLDSNNYVESEISSLNKTPEETLSYIISPLPSSDFFTTYWEKNPLHINRKDGGYFKNIFSSKQFDNILRNNPLYYTRNIDVVTYESGERKTHNPEGRAVPASVWDYYLNGCSVRLLNPQTYNSKIRNILAILQEYFGTMAGANIYLTPPGSQGFAPHFDDIEAFVLQLEGRKHWKIYKPNIEMTLPRYSSKNFMRNELPGEPTELTLEAGDLLYFPRGFIHEARTDADSHSLHITISVYQNTSYVDLIEKCLMESLKAASASDIEFRRGLPLQYLKHVGLANNKIKSNTRTEIIQTVKNLIGKLSEYVSVDNGADQLGRKFMYDSLPPQLTESERVRTCKQDGDFLTNGKVVSRGVFEPDTEVRLIRYHSIRLVLEENVFKLYYCTENADVYHGEEEQCLEVNKEMVATFKVLLKSYPNYKKIEELPNKDQVELMHVIGDLWEKGLIVTKLPLTVFNDD
ncbi:ribosomal oxygenase 1 [Onthophagus taurus]|uniref:ribosomal oxygenase 1 n=1 Tax=Onthophagus taurus TaxID=166361 RepID=UPI0039BE0E65